MSSDTWMPDALSSELRYYKGPCWRFVEAQHLVSTLKLVDTLAEQRLLEELIEKTKPPMPPECRQLDYLLATPFRYEPEYPKGSRFRRAGKTPGVYYAAENPETAAAEMAFYRLLFFAESPATPWPSNALEFSAFAALVSTDALIDLTKPPFEKDRTQWIDPINYEPCQVLAEKSREAGAEIIRYESVRDPKQGSCLAVLMCRAFSEPRPVESQTWRLHFSSSGVQAIREFPYYAVEFEREALVKDPRIANFEWDRPQ